MKSIPPIKAVMTPFPYWVDIGEPLHRAREMMALHKLRHLPVMERGEPVGILSEADLNRSGQQGSGGSTESRVLVRDVCEKGAYVVELSEPLDRVLMNMAGKHSDSALVVKDGRLAGIFTQTDACRCFGKLLRSLFPPGGKDDAA